MTGFLKWKRPIHPSAAAVLILFAMAGFIWSWWRLLIYHEVHNGGGGGGPSSGSRPPQVTLPGLDEVSVDTLAGDMAPGTEDGPGHAARFDRPTGIAIDLSGRLVVADTGNHRIRLVAADGQTTTLSGGVEGYQDGPVSTARFSAPCGIAVGPDGAVYVADTGNHAVRKIVNGEVTTLTGKPLPDESAPVAVALDGSPPRQLLVADAATAWLWVCPLGGGGFTRESHGISGHATGVVAVPQHAIAAPKEGVLLAGSRRLQNQPVKGADTSAVASERVPALRRPIALCPVGGDLLVVDAQFACLFRVHASDVTVLAGVCSSGGSLQGSRDGTGARALFSMPAGVAYDGRRYAYVTDSGNNNIRRIDLSGALMPDGRTLR